MIYNITLVGNGNEELTLPVTPERIKITSECEVRKYDNFWRGPILKKGFMQPRELKLESFIPSIDSETDSHVLSKYFGFACVNKIESWRKSQSSIRIIIKEMEIDTKFIIGSFNYEAGKGGLIWYTLEATEV